MVGRDIADLRIRSKEKIAERLNKLIAKIREMQRSGMNGEKKVDVVLVSFSLCLGRRKMLIQDSLFMD